MLTDNQTARFRRFVIWLFPTLIAFNVAQLIDHFSTYYKASGLLQMFRSRPVATDNDVYVNNLSEQMSTAVHDVVIAVVELLIISFLWIYFSQRKPSSPNAAELRADE